MNWVDRQGVFKARVVDWSLGQAQESGMPQFAIEFAIEQYFENGQWVDWSEYGQQIIGYFSPFKKDQTPNETKIKQLKESLGWDGLSLASLETGDYSSKVVQITVKESEYKGKKSLKVEWMNPEDYQPGLRKLEEKEVKAMSATWDVKLRALGGNGAKGGTRPTPPKKPEPTTK